MKNLLTYIPYGSSFLEVSLRLLYRGRRVTPFEMFIYFRKYGKTFYRSHASL